MECNRVRKMLSEYLDETLDTRSREAVAGHLGDCPACRKELASLKAVIEELRSLDPVDAPPDFLARVHHRLESGFSLKKLGRALFYPLSVKVPMQLASAVALGGLVLLIVTTQWSEKPPEVSLKTLSESPVLERDETARLFQGLESIPPPRKDNVAGSPSPGEVRPHTPIQLVLIISGGEAKASLPHAPDRPPAEEGTAVPPQAADGAGDRMLRKEKAELGAAARARYKAENEKSAPAAPFDAARSRVEILVRQLGGRIVSEGGDLSSGGPQFVIASIPAAGYFDLLEGMERIGALRGTSPAPPAVESGTIDIRIRLIPSR